MMRRVYGIPRKPVNLDHRTLASTSISIESSAAPNVFPCSLPHTRIALRTGALSYTAYGSNGLVIGTPSVRKSRPLRVATVKP